MPEYLSPGVYIEEVNTGPRPIEGVGTSCAAFVGFAADGPINEPQLISNWMQYVETFCDAKNGRRDGSFQIPHKTERGRMINTYLGQSVRGFFNNGGGRCYVARVGDYSLGTKPNLQIPKLDGNVPLLTIEPKEEATRNIKVEIAPAEGENPPAGSFTMIVTPEGGGAPERYENVLLRADGENSVVTKVQERSRLITVTVVATGPIVQRTLQTGTYPLNVTSPAMEVSVQSTDFIGDAGERKGIEGMQVAEEVTMLCCPDLMAAHQAGYLDDEGMLQVQHAMITHCELMRDRLAILDTPYNKVKPDEVRKWRSVAGFNSKFAALYYPWISVPGADGRLMDIPPSGHIAGIYARSDRERGVHKAPANENVRDAVKVNVQLTKGEQDMLNPEGVNCIRSFPNQGVTVWGARTLSDDAAWRYINVRRLFNFVEKSIERGTQWVVFEPNDHDLWARVRRDVTAFLTGVWRGGALFGRKPEEAFYVKCDEELNPESVRNEGKLIVEIGLAPVKPAEFVIFRLSQFSGGGA